MNTLDQLLKSLQTVLADKAVIIVDYEQITLVVNINDLINICLVLRDHAMLQFNQLMDLCAVDYLHYGMDEWATNTATSEGFSRGVMPRINLNLPNFPARFAVVYNLLSTILNHRVRVKIFVDENSLIVPSIVNIWNCANWYEREAYDLFGIQFLGHPDLRRLLTDYEFVGHPFRKDFPLIGHVEMRYDATAEKVVYEPVSISPRILTPKVIRHIGQKENG